MNCHKIQKILPDYIESDLKSKSAEEVFLHLGNCATCNKMHSQLLITIQQLKPKSEIAEQPFYYTRLKQRMENNRVKRSLPSLNPNLKKVLQPLVYAATIIIVVYVGVLIGSSSSGISQYSGFELKDKEYIEDFADYNYINDLEIEPIETLFLTDTLKN